jgi:mannose-6-phosphate isomerase-like protein (cupin superfamily)
MVTETAMNDPLIKAAGDGEFWTTERCFIRELVNTAAIPDFSLADTRVEPGVTTELHSLSVREWYYITVGAGLMEVGGGPPFAVGPGDTVEIPAGVAQRITNTGTTDLRFQCVCLPRFTPDCYQSLNSA